MKRILLFICIMTFMFLHFINGQCRVGLSAGLSISNFNQVSSDAAVSENIFFSFDYQLSKNICLMSGFGLVSKGSNNFWNGLNYAPVMKNMSVRLPYLEIPISLGYKISIAEKIKLVPNVGVFVSCGILGYGEIIVINNEVEDPYRFYTNTWSPFAGNSFNDFSKTNISNFERFDYGIRCGMSIENNHFVYSVNYELGTSSIWIEPDNGHSIRNGCLMINIGYMFNL